MTRPTFGVLVALALGACGTEPEPHAVEVKDVVGFWHVSLTPDPGCTRNNPAPALDLTLSALGPAGADVLTLQGGWELAPVSNPGRELSGTLDLRTGAFEADLIGAQPATRARLNGTVKPEASLTGTLIDPADGAGAAILGSGSCTYAADGRH